MIEDPNVYNNDKNNKIDFENKNINKIINTNITKSPSKINIE